MEAVTTDIGMQERVRLVNGRFAIESAPRCGTTVRVRMALPQRPPADGGGPATTISEPNGSTTHTSHEHNQCAARR